MGFSMCQLTHRLLNHRRRYSQVQLKTSRHFIEVIQVHQVHRMMITMVMEMEEMVIMVVSVRQCLGVIMEVQVTTIHNITMEVLKSRTDAIFQVVSMIDRSFMVRLINLVLLNFWKDYMLIRPLTNFLGLKCIKPNCAMFFKQMQGLGFCHS